MPDQMPLANILVPYPVDRAYSYLIPEGMTVKPGDIVTVPLGSREIPGVVWDGAPDEARGKRLKSIIALCDSPPVTDVQRRFIDWVAAYTMSPKGFVLKMTLSVPAALERPAPATGYKLPDWIRDLLSSPSPQRGEGRGEGLYDQSTHLHIQRSRELRQNSSEAEKKLWSLLLDRRLQGYKFKRQFSISPYIVNFICLAKNLIIELDGGQHGEQQTYDARRTVFLEKQGFRVLRFWNNDALTNTEGMLQTIVDALDIPSPQPSPRRGEGEGKRERFLRNLSPQRRRVLEVMTDGLSRRPSELAELSGCTVGVIKSMAAANLLETVGIASAAPCRRPDPERPGPALSGPQGAAADHLRGMARSKGFETALLDGVTGAGKTEVYFEGMAEALRQGRQVLLMLPEIALSNAFLDRFQDRFSCRPALWHSNLTPAQRRVTWRGVAEGQTKVVVGARSSLFLPFADLGMIVVDEEHDTAYKQEDNVIYHARDMAIVRAHLGKIPIVLVSATPSLETMANAWAGRYTHLHLPDRHGGATLPKVSIIDMKQDRPERQHFIAPTLRAELQKVLEAGEQSLLFLNRRGYAPLTLCRTCGHRMDCPRCTAWLVEHKRSGRLQCHHCGFSTRLPSACPSCGDQDSLAPCGPGVERVLEEVKELFPEARTVVLASDTTEGPDELRTLLQDIRAHKYDIIIGTQIIAKGHHFPDLTLVGVIDADIGLKGGDLRAAERTYQLLHQVAGRAGRAEKPGRVYLQTFYPDNKVMQAMTGHERDVFLDVEAQEREGAHMPPYSRLVGIIVSGKNERQVIDLSNELGKISPNGQGIQTFGPADAPFYRLRGNYRRRLLVRADKDLNVQKAVAEWTRRVKVPSALRIYIDIDPQSFL
jgi:primosomal protein N' (replication factor Y)